MSRITGQMETIPYASLSMRKADKSQTFFMNPGRDGKFTLKEATGRPNATPSPSSSLRGDDKSLAATIATAVAAALAQQARS